jgi:hypothetical protein
MNLDDKIKEAFARHETDVQPQPGAWSGVENSIGRRHRGRVLVTALGAAATIAVLSVAIPRIGERKPAPFIPASPGSTPTQQASAGAPHVVGKIAVPAFRLAAGEGSLWALTSEAGRGRVVRIDPERKRAISAIEVGSHPRGIAAGSDGVWVTNGFGCQNPDECSTAQPTTAQYPKDNSVMRIDPATNQITATISVEDPQDVALGLGAVWVTSLDAPDGLRSTLLRIDPGTNRVAARIVLGTSNRDATVAVSDRYVWVVVSESSEPSFGGKVYRIDPTTNEAIHVADIAHGTPEMDIAASANAVWVTTSGARSPSALTRLDPVSGRIEAAFDLPDASGVTATNTVTIGEGFVWVTGSRGALWKVDALHNAAVGDPLYIGDAPPVGTFDVATASGSIWVASMEGTIWQLVP